MVHVKQDDKQADGPEPDAKSQNLIETTASAVCCHRYEGDEEHDSEETFPEHPCPPCCTNHAATPSSLRANCD